MNKRIVTRFLAFVFSPMLTGGLALAQVPGCASMAVPVIGNSTYQWYFTENGQDDGKITDLQQAANGNLSGGTFWTNQEGNWDCGDAYSVTGTADGNETFELTGTDHANPPGFNCASSFTGVATISDPACSQGTFTWKNTLGKSGTDAMQITLGNYSNPGGILPTGETGSSLIGLANATTGVYSPSVAPTAFNFTGRTVVESFPLLSQNCTSHPGGPQVLPPVPSNFYPELNGSINVSKGTPADGIATGYQDAIGIPPAAVDQIRKSYNAPCTIAMTQDMFIDISTGNKEYQFQTNSDEIVIGTDTMSTARNGQLQSWTYLSPGQVDTTPDTDIVIIR